MKNFITSDLHFFHQNIIKFCPDTRGHYSSIDQMHDSMIMEWNAQVDPEDHTYILGDVAFCSAGRAADILKQLNGAKTLIIGNHDEKLVLKQEFRDCFIEVTHYKTIRHGLDYIVMSHYPIARWDRQHYGSIHFHGHSHGKSAGLEGMRAMDVGYDATGEVVTPLEIAIGIATNTGTY